MLIKRNTPRAVIWDLSNTLLRPTDAYLPKEIKKNLSLLLYFWGGKKIVSKLDKIAITILSKAHSYASPGDHLVKLHTSEPVPTHVCSWLRGIISSSEALEKALASAHGQIFPCITQQDYTSILDMLTCFFNPEILAQSMQPLPLISLLHKIAQSQKYSLYILSNWDKESFAVLSTMPKAQEILCNFDPHNITISANTGFLKPQGEIFTYAINKYNLDPQATFFIDDQEENINQARVMGFRAIYAHDIKLINALLIS